MKHYRIGAVLLLCSALTSCSDAPTADPGTFWYRYNTAIFLEAGRTTYMVSSGLRSRDRAWAAFHTPDSLGANAGVVSFEDLSLTLQDSLFPTLTGSLIPGRIYNAYSIAAELPLQLGGRLNDFVATGGPSVPALAVSAPSPVRDIAVLGPLDDDLLSLNEGFTIRWEKSTQEGTIIDIRIWSLSPDATAASEIIEPIVDDGGSYLVSATALRAFPAGPIGISVRRFLRTTGSLANERRYDARIYTQRIVYAELR